MSMISYSNHPSIMSLDSLSLWTLWKKLRETEVVFLGLEILIALLSGTEKNDHTSESNVNPYSMLSTKTGRRGTKSCSQFAQNKQPTYFPTYAQWYLAMQRVLA